MSTLDSGEVAFDECGTGLGAVLASRVLVCAASVPDGDSSGEVVVIRDQAALDTFWETAGLISAGEPVPVVDFGSEQIVGYGRNACSCKSRRWISGFYVSAADGSRWMAKITDDGLCATCDTTAEPVMDVWAMPIGDVDTCEAGQECGP